MPRNRDVVVLQYFTPVKLNSIRGIRRSLIIIGTIFLCLSHPAIAEGPQWTFEPQHFGAALVEGGWMTSRTIAQINGSPEFTFPLQLVYLTTHTQRGEFGDQWFCPQLESNLLPRGMGVLVWTQPSGGLIGLFQERGYAILFSDRSGEWHAKITGPKTVITNIRRASQGKLNGWEYTYNSGKLVSIQAPSGRLLEYTYTGQKLVQVTLRDPQTGATRIVVTITHRADGRLTGLNASGVDNQFGYQNGPDGRLLSWQRPGMTKPDVFDYAKQGVLASVQPGAGQPTTFQTQFAAPKDPGGKPINTPAEQAKVANYRVTDDGVFTYVYGAEGAVTLRDKAGASQSFDYSAKRGASTYTDAGGQRTQSYYYRAPGQKHDGKLRQIVQGGVTLVENFYEKATGNLIESIDRDGISTYYEYGPGCDKPVRVLRGTVRKRSVVAMMKYDPAGHLIEQTDASGKTTKFTYNGRGEPDSVTQWDGSKFMLAYDSFGHCKEIALSSDKTKATLHQQTEYGDDGRIRRQTSPDGQTTEYAYDAGGNVSEIRRNGVLMVNTPATNLAWSPRRRTPSGASQSSITTSAAITLRNICQMAQRQATNTTN